MMSYMTLYITSKDNFVGLDSISMELVFMRKKKPKKVIGELNVTYAQDSIIL